jgi:hypothetical protein
MSRLLDEESVSENTNPSRKTIGRSKTFHHEDREVPHVKFRFLLRALRAFAVRKDSNMINQRIDIDKRRWMAVRDGLFIYTDAPSLLRFVWCRRVVVSRPDMVDVIQRSRYFYGMELILYRFVVVFLGAYFSLYSLVSWWNPFSSYPVFQTIGLSLFIALLAVLGSFTCRKTRFCVDGFSFGKRDFMFAHVYDANPELDTILDKLEQQPDASGFLTPSPVRIFLPRIWFWRPILAVVLLSTPWVGPVSPMHEPHAIWHPTLLVLGGFALSAAIMRFYLPTHVREARSALLEGDVAAAESLLTPFLERNPNHAFANYLRMMVALLQGDPGSAADFARAVRHRNPFFWFWLEHAAVANAMEQLDDYIHERNAEDDAEALPQKADWEEVPR